MAFRKRKKCPRIHASFFGNAITARQYSDRFPATAAFFVPTVRRNAALQKRMSSIAAQSKFMNRKYIKFGVAAAVLAGFTALVVYQFTGGSDYSTDIGSLKTKFNRDKGKLRLLVLLSPT